MHDSSRAVGTSGAAGIWDLLLAQRLAPATDRIGVSGGVSGASGGLPLTRAGREMTGVTMLSPPPCAGYDAAASVAAAPGSHPCG